MNEVRNAGCPGSNTRQNNRQSQGGKPSGAAEPPYPKVQVKGVNPGYARAMLDNMGGVNSEMSAVSLYFYNHLVLESIQEELAKVYHQVSIVEMHHLELFGELALQLGADPRLWARTPCGRQYWSPGYNRYPKPLKQMLCHSIQGEKAAIRKYEAQSKQIEDEGVICILKRIIEDEEKHVELFTGFLEKYCK